MKGGVVVAIKGDIRADGDGVTTSCGVATKGDVVVNMVCDHITTI